MLTCIKCYNSQDKKWNGLDGLPDLNVSFLIMLAWKLSIFWWTVRIAHSFTHSFAEIFTSRESCPVISWFSLIISMPSIFTLFQSDSIFFPYLFLFFRVLIIIFFLSLIWWYLKCATFLSLIFVFHVCLPWLLMSLWYFPFLFWGSYLLSPVWVLNRMWIIYLYDLGAPATYVGGSASRHWLIPVVLDKVTIFFTVEFRA